MGRHYKYTPAQLDEALRGYFRSISRSTPIVDENGQPIISDEGTTVLRTEYLIPPTVGGLCGALEISESTWRSYCANPDYGTDDACRRLKDYLEGEVLTRKGQDVRGPQFLLQAKYGYSTAERREIDLGPTAARVATAALSVDDRERLLREIAEEFGGDAD